MKIHTLEVDSVFKSFNKEYLLSNVYLSCETKEIVGIFGKNGTGKSTLLKIIFGIEKSENKFLKIDKKVLNKIYLKKNMISFLPQSNFIPKYLVVSKSISLFIEEEIMKDFLEDEIIDLIKDKKVGHLSGGELRYLEIKLILYNNTKFCFLDEPFSGLSPLLIEKVKKNIQIASQKKGVLITDHNYQDVLDISTKAYLIKDRATKLLTNNNELIEYGYLPEKQLL